jgi:hypothetical protein
MADRDKWFDEVGAEDKYSTKGDGTELEFTHGIETEYFLVDKKGVKLSHAEFGGIYEDIISDSLIEALEDSLPIFYDKKVTLITPGPSKSSAYDALHMRYEVRGKVELCLRCSPYEIRSQRKGSGHRAHLGGQECGGMAIG